LTASKTSGRHTDFTQRIPDNINTTIETKFDCSDFSATIQAFQVVTHCRIVNSYRHFGRMAVSSYSGVQQSTKNDFDTA